MKIKELKLREKVILFFFFLLFMLILVRLYNINVVQKSFLTSKFKSITERNILKKGSRGVILDTNNIPLAVSTPIISIMINLSEINKTTINTDLKNLSKIINKPYKILQNKFSKNNKKYLYLDRGLNPSLKEDILKLNIAGLSIIEEQKRFYPFSYYLSTIIGFTNDDGNGIDGVEYSKNEELNGETGRTQTTIDLKKHILNSVELKKVEDGEDIKLTINSNIQSIAYKELKNQVDLSNADSGSVVVLNAKTGDVLAMVNYPTFNPNDLSTLNKNNFKNKSLQEVFDPGSIIKPLIIAKALNDNKININTVFDTKPYIVGTKLIKDDHPISSMNTSDIIIHSSDIGTSKIAMKYNSKTLWEYYRSIGFGTKSKIGLPGDTSGILLNYNKWMPMDQALMSFGYGISINLLQIARSYTIFTNDGCLLPVNLYVESENFEDKKCVKIIDKQTSNMLKIILGKTVDVGTGKFAKVENVSVAGKTGTAQKLINGRYSNKVHVASFVGFSPIEKPKYIIAVMVDNPKKGSYYGGGVAAPVFSKILTNINNYERN